MKNVTLEQFLREKSKAVSVSKPLVLNLANTDERRTLSKLVAGDKIRQVGDDYEEQLKEYFAVMNPTIVYTDEFEGKYQDYARDCKKKFPLWQQGRWVYFPWLYTLVHILEEKPFYLVRTARNRNLINEKEQDKFYNCVVGIAGLSVGNSVALAIVLQGGARHLRLADFDRLALSNMNRIRAGVENLGLPKAEMTARQVYALNPYAKIELFPEGLTKNNIAKFFGGPPALDIVIDEIDNLAVKLLIRMEAKRRKLAVVMAADNGDNGVVDLERYDENPTLEFFHGRMGKVSYSQLLNLDKFGIGKMITKYVGAENVTPRMQESLLQMGKTIVSWPQLGGAALLNGSAVAYCVRKILNKQPLESNRALIELDEKLLPGYNSPRSRRQRHAKVEKFKKIFGL